MRSPLIVNELALILLFPASQAFTLSMQQGVTSSKPPSDYSIIQKGGLFIQPNWITAKEIDALRRDIAHLRENGRHTCSLSLDYNNNNNKTLTFIPSGLSNRVKGDDNEFGKSDRLTCTLTAGLEGNGDCWIRDVMDAKLNGLIEEITEQQPSRQRLSLEEQYYSISPVGSLLPRHMDERHEETKGSENAWLSETRRSISWLVYLSDSETVTGGQFRAFTRHCKGPYCGAHDGNVQIGWLDYYLDEHKYEHEQRYDPVFLDSWVKTKTVKKHNIDDINEHGARQWQPLYSLYRMKMKNGKEEREYLSHPFGTTSPGWPQAIDLEPHKLGNALASQLFPQVQSKFILTDKIHDNPTDIQPTAGTLVLFDSVAVPHEVLEVTRGDRLALAGWFHETQQVFPDWYGT